MTDDADPHQALLAQQEMATWLAYPTELEQAPDELELLRTVEYRTPDGPCDLFVFRFRIGQPHWAADRGWMIGVAGPYPRSSQPTTQSLGYTSSRLTRESAMTIEEHVDELIGSIAGWVRTPPPGASRVDRGG